MRVWVIVGFLVGVAAALVAAYFLPERETAITHGVMTEEIRRAAELGPLVNELKELKR